MREPPSTSAPRGSPAPFAPKLGQTGYVCWQGQRLPCRVHNGQVWVSLPFRIARAKLRQILRDSLYAVGWNRERLDSEAWGLEYDIEGYYPYWVFPDPQHPGHTIFAFPPRDYLDSTDEYQTSGADQDQAYLVPEGNAGVEAATGLHADPDTPGRLSADVSDVSLEISEPLAPELPASRPSTRPLLLPRTPAIGPGVQEEVAHWLPFLWQAREEPRDANP